MLERYHELEPELEADGKLSYREVMTGISVRSSMATNVYVDAFNLYYGSLKETPYRWLDLGALCARLLPKDRINRTDLKLPIEIAQSELGIRVGVVNPHPSARRSRALQPTFFKQLRPSALQACQFAPALVDARGEIRKPASW